MASRLQEMHLLLQFLACYQVLQFAAASPSCAEPTNGADTTCPLLSHCWDTEQSETTVVWSLYFQCTRCLFARQEHVVAQNGQTVMFETDGSFQRSRNLKILQVDSEVKMRNCDLSGAVEVGNLTPHPLDANPIPDSHSTSIDITAFLRNHRNFFLADNTNENSNLSVPSSCEQGARLIVYKGNFECGDVHRPCSEVGPCVFEDDSSNFTCQCPGGFTGSACEKIDECFQNIQCGDPDYEGVCVDGDCDFSCNCIGGRSSSDGDNKACDVLPTDCSQKPCLNGGTCIELFGRVICECFIGFSSDGFCANNDECVSNPCQNGGTCIDGPLQYSCSCLAGFTGDDCSINIDDCFPSPCLDSGVCSDGVHDVRCMCSSPRTGKFCQIDMTIPAGCDIEPCANGGTCLQRLPDDRPSCVCGLGFTGLRCDEDVDVTVPSFGDVGESYLQLKADLLTYNISATDIVMTLKVCSSYGLILLGSEGPDEIDFLSLHVTDRFLDFRFDVGDGLVRIVSTQRIPMCGWITVNIKRNLHVGELFVDGNFIGSGRSPGGFSGSSLTHLYLGGAPVSQWLSQADRIGPLTGFVGCIRSLSMNDEEVNLMEDMVSSFNVGQCPAGSCNPSPCLNDGICQDIGPLIGDFNCSCATGFSGMTCQTRGVCHSRPCLHGGVCRRDDDITEGFRCFCSALFTGVLCQTPSQLDTVSFSYFGESYTSWSLDASQIALSTVLSLEVEPRVNPSNGLLACMGQMTTDFLAVFVSDGELVVSMDFGGLNPLVFNTGLSLPADQQSTIEVSRLQGVVSVTVWNSNTGVGGRSASATLASRFFKMDGANTLIVGGVPPHMTVLYKINVPELSSALAQGFDGCIRNVQIQRQPLEIAKLLSNHQVSPCHDDVCGSSSNPCQNGGTCSPLGSSIACQCPPGLFGPVCDEIFDPCVDLNCESGATCINTENGPVCACSLGRTGNTCEEDTVIEVARFNDNFTSFMAFNPLDNVRSSTTVMLQFKPEGYYGLMVYMDKKEQVLGRTGDFLSVGLYDGFVELRYNLGSATAVIRSAQRVTLNTWHKLTATRENRAGSLVIDDAAPETGSSSGTTVSLDVTSEVYIGGHEDYTAVNDHVGVTSGFSGCISKAFINTVSYDMTINGTSNADRSDGRRGRGVSACSSHPCDDNVCQNGGTCSIENNQHAYHCDCVDGFTGRFCETVFFDLCQVNNGFCHADSTCVFNSKTLTRECLCPLVPQPRRGDTCQEVFGGFAAAKFSRNSYAEYRFHLPNERQTSLTFDISSQSTHGLVFTTQPFNSQFPDFLAVGINNGFLVFIYEIGDGDKSITSPVNVTGPPGSWHEVLISRSGREGALTVDGVTVIGTATGVSLNANVGGEFYLGGIPSKSSNLADYEEVLDGAFRHGLIGCVRDLQLNGNDFDLHVDALKGYNVDSCL